MIMGKQRGGLLVAVLVLGVGCGASSVSLETTTATASPPADPPRVAPSPWVVEEHPPRATAAPSAPGSAAPELVLQGGHILWIHDVALSPDGHQVALLSLDMPDFGQAMTPSVPLATLTLLDTRTRQVRASWHFVAPDLEGAGRVRFSRLGDRLTIEGQGARSFDLLTGAIHEVGGGVEWGVPDPTGRLVAVSAHAPAKDSGQSTKSAKPGLSVVRFDDGRPVWTSSDGNGLDGPRAAAWHPFGDGRLVVAHPSGPVRLYDARGQALAETTGIGAADVLGFRSTGGALYLRGKDDPYAQRKEGPRAFDPRDLKPLGATPWRSIEAMSHDGQRVVGLAEEPGKKRPPAGEDFALFDVTTGARIAKLVAPEDVDWTATERSPAAFAFAPEGDVLWSCWYTEADVAAAPRALEMPATADPNAETVEFVACQSWDARSGARRQRFYRALPEPIPKGRGPLSLLDRGPRLAVARGGRLVVALMQRVVLFTATREIAHLFGDPGIEAILSDAAEAPDGRGIALNSPIAVGWFDGKRSDVSLCPGLLGQPSVLRFEEAGVTAYSERYECSTRRPSPTQHEAVLGVSDDGQVRALAEGDVFDGTGTVVIRRGTSRVRLAGVEAWCQSDGCGPEVAFAPGERHVLVARTLFDTRTGRPLRALKERVASFSPDGRQIVLEEPGDDGEYRRVEDLRTGRVVARFVAGRRPRDEQGKPIATPTAFSADSRYLAFASFTSSKPAITLADVPSGRVLWQHALPTPATRAWINRTGHLVVEVAAAPKHGRSLHVFELTGGRALGSKQASDDRPFVASSDATRFGWCDAGRLRIVESAGSVVDAAPCLGRPLMVGRRFAVFVRDARAHLVRLDDQRSITLRLVIVPDREAWWVAEDGKGAWALPKPFFDRFLRRAQGSITEAPLQELATNHAGYDPNLLQRFFTP